MIIEFLDAQYGSTVARLRRPYVDLLRLTTSQVYKPGPTTAQFSNQRTPLNIA